MKTKTRILILIVLSVVLLSSCQTVYVDQKPIVTEGNTSLVEVDLEKEYFTTGELRKEVSASGGCLYGDSWIYVEINKYDKYLRPGPNETDIYQKDIQVLRIVKVNAHTGHVSSICLDPSCTHSPGSECIAVAPVGTSTALVQDVVGDWLMFQYSRRTKEYGLLNTTYIYNLKTGEALNVFEQDVGNTIMTRWSSRCNAFGKLYGVKHVLDYTGTGYTPGKSEASKYTPETRSYLCVYDFDTREMSELFEIPSGYSITEVTNKRFILSGGGKLYTVDRNGENLTEMDVLNFSPVGVCGRYAYGQDSDNNALLIYDIETNTKKAIPNEGVMSTCSIFNAGIIKRKMTNTEEFDKFNENFEEKAKAYIAEQMKIRPGATNSELYSEFSEMRNKARYTMDCALYLIKDPTGEGEEIKIFEYEKCLITLMHSTSKYLYCGISTYDKYATTDAGKPERIGPGFFIVDMETGALIEIPYLEMVLPAEYQKPE